MDFKILELAIKQLVDENRTLENPGADVSVSELIHCGKKSELARVYGEDDVFNPDIYAGYITELFIKAALVKAYGEERVHLEKSYAEEYKGLRIVGHVDAVIEFEDKVVGIDVKAPKKVLASGGLQEKEGILVDYDGLILNNPTYALQAGLYRRLMEKSHDKRVEFYLLYHTLVNGRDRVFAAVPIEHSLGDQTLDRLINRFNERKPAFRNECESYCRFKRLNLCQGVEVSQEEPYTDLKGIEKLIEENLRLLAEYEAIKKEYELSLKTLQQVIVDGTMNYKGMEFGWKPVVGYTLNRENLLRFIQNASEEELRLVVEMLTHIPARGKDLHRLSLTEEVQNIKFIPPNPNQRRRQ